MPKKKENKRYHNEVRCFFCSRFATETHHIYGGFNRTTSEKYGCTCNLCRECHYKVHNSSDRTYMQTLRVDCEIWFIKEYDTTIEEFIKLFGRNYL